MQTETVTMQRTIVSHVSHIRLGQRIRLSFDNAREQWVLLGPEKVIVLDEIAHNIISRCDGSNCVSDIIQQLSIEYDASTEDIQQDVLPLLQSLVDKKFLQL